MIDILVNLFLTFFSWLLKNILIGLIIFWVLGKIAGYSFKKTTEKESNRKFWLSILLIVIIFYLLIKEGYIHVGI